MPHQAENILLFDGVCNLCNNVVKFIIKRDKSRKFKFASLQSATAETMLSNLGLSTNNFDSIVLIKEGMVLKKSAAALQVLKQLGWPWKLLYPFIFLPEPIRDFFYDIVAKSRYRLFGKQQTCMVPSPEVQDRFL